MGTLWCRSVRELLFRLMRRGVLVVVLIALVGVFIQATSVRGQEETLTAQHDAAIYTAGSDLTVTMGITYTGTVTSLGVVVDLPEGWTFVSKGGDDAPPQSKVSASGDVELFWIEVPPSPVDFTYTVHAPQGATGTQAIGAQVLYRRMGEQLTQMAAPNPLSIQQLVPDALDVTQSATPYEPGGPLMVTVQIQYSNQVKAVGMEVNLPNGWNYSAKGGEDQPDNAKTGPDGRLEFFWINVPATPIDFTYTVDVPPGTNGQQQIGALVKYRRLAGELTAAALPSPLALDPAALSATHATADGYVAGSGLTVSSQVTYTGSLTALGMEVDVPEGWTYASKGGTNPPDTVKALPGGNLELSWTQVPASPVDFTYTVDVPGGTVGPQQISGLVRYRRLGPESTLPALPDPLNVDREGADLSLTPPVGYRGNDPSTYPLLAGEGAVYTATALGGSGIYTWTVKDAAGQPVFESGPMGGTLPVGGDDLFVNGAGVYGIHVYDPNNPDFAPPPVFVRVPMRIVPMTGSHADTGPSAVFTVEGNPEPYTLTWAVTDEKGTVIPAPAGFGQFTETTGAPTNYFSFNAPISETVTFRAEATSSSPVLAENGLATVRTGVHVVTPVAQLQIQVSDAATGFGIGGANISALHDATIKTTTDENGAATITGLQNTGLVYQFAVEAFGFLPQVFRVSDLDQVVDVLLEKIVTLGFVEGKVTLKDDNFNDKPPEAGITVRCRNANGDYITNAAGVPIELMADPGTGTYTLTFDVDAAGAGPYKVVAFKSGYLTREDENAGVVGNVTVNTAGNDIALNPVTRITVTPALDDPNVTFGITALPAFNGSLDEVEVFEGTGPNDPQRAATYKPGDKSYEVTLAAPATGSALTVFVRADTSTAGRTAGEGYYASKTSSYVGGAQPPKETPIANPSTQGGQAGSSSGQTQVNLQANSLTGDIIPNVIVAISEADPVTAGATRITGSQLVEVTLTNASTGEEVPDGQINKIYITITFDPAKVPPGSLENGTMVIFQAETMAEMLAGSPRVINWNVQGVDADYVNGKATFWVSDLSVFGIGAIAAAAAGAAGAGGGGGCFIGATAQQHPAVGSVAGHPVALSLLGMALLATIWALRRRGFLKSKRRDP